MTAGAFVLHVEDDIGPDRYVVECDVDFRGGLGVATFGPAARAKRFADSGAALAFWKRQSTVCPWRPDGRANRPLTAYTVTLERVEESGEAEQITADGDGWGTGG